MANRYRTSKGGYYSNMPSDKYWAQRSKEQLSETMANADDVTRYLKNVYKENLIKLCKDYNELMKPFIVDGEIDIALLNKARTYDDVFKYKWKRIEEQISFFSKEMNDIQRKQITDLLTDTYTDNVVKNLEVFGKSADSLALLDTKAVETAVKMPFTKDAREFSDAVWENMYHMNKDLKKTLSDAVANGESIQKTSSRFKKIMGSSTYNTQRLIRTETCAIYTKASIDSYNELGINKLKILGESENCDICGEYIDTIVAVEDAMEGINTPPFHPNCKCCVAPVVK